MGDRMGVMRAGRLAQLGPPERVFRQPANRFTAEFLGQAEFLPAQVTQDGLQSELGLLPQSVPLPPGESVQVGFRADDLDFAPDPMGQSVVLARFFRGADCLYRLRLGSGRIVHSMQPHYRSHSPGTAVRVWFAPNHVLPCFRGSEAIETELIGTPGQTGEG